MRAHETPHPRVEPPGASPSAATHTLSAAAVARRPTVSVTGSDPRRPDADPRRPDADPRRLDAHSGANGSSNGYGALGAARAADSPAPAPHAYMQQRPRQQLLSQPYRGQGYAPPPPPHQCGGGGYPAPSHEAGQASPAMRDSRYGMGGGGLGGGGMGGGGVGGGGMCGGGMGGGWGAGRQMGGAGPMMGGMQGQRGSFGGAGMSASGHMGMGRPPPPGTGQGNQQMSQQQAMLQQQMQQQQQQQWMRQQGGPQAQMGQRWWGPGGR